METECWPISLFYSGLRATELAMRVVPVMNIDGPERLVHTPTTAIPPSPEGMGLWEAAPRQVCPAHARRAAHGGDGAADLSAGLCGG
mmetsp:Transcript_68530/g.109601  ORF Transcript_68530/g.109601 Transcript_68530/m.109601 type:complete len:87 (-) Transcript_68530:70-330(-)